MCSACKINSHAFVPVQFDKAIVDIAPGCHAWHQDNHYHSGALVECFGKKNQTWSSLLRDRGSASYCLSVWTSMQEYHRMYPDSKKRISVCLKSARSKDWRCHCDVVLCEFLTFYCFGGSKLKNDQDDSLSLYDYPQNLLSGGGIFLLWGEASLLCWSPDFLWLVSRALVHKRWTILWKKNGETEFMSRNPNGKVRRKKFMLRKPVARWTQGKSSHWGPPWIITALARRGQKDYFVEPLWQNCTEV